MGDQKLTGRVTIPTEIDVVPETLELMKRGGSDAIVTAMEPMIRKD